MCRHHFFSFFLPGRLPFPALPLVLVLMTAMLTGCSFFKTADSSEDALPPLIQGTPVPYNARIVVANQNTANDNSATDTSPYGDIEKIMKGNSQLLQLLKEPPDSLLGLERRARVDEETGVNLLHSLGYYEGKASFTADDKTQPVTVTLTLEPGPRYTVESAHIVYEPKPLVPASFLNRTQENGFFFRQRESLPGPTFPDTLRGVSPGDPAEADPILDAVEKIPDRLQREGYPFAHVAKTRYTLNRERRVLLAEITVDPGPPATMGGIRVTGAQKVNSAYLERLIPWQEGQPWNERLVNAYGDTLRQMGLFRSVRVSPITMDSPPQAGEAGGPAAGSAPDGRNATAHVLANQTQMSQKVSPEGSPISVPIAVEVAETAFRTVGVSARYATDVGYGVQGTWDHRNLFGNGESLKTKATLAQDKQGISADFEKPAFGRADQTLLAGSALAREKTDAYTKTAANAYVGLDRRLAPHWWATGRFFAENGALNENAGKSQYRFLSASLSLKRDTRNNLLNPTRGSSFTISLTPYSGHYRRAFNTIAVKADASAYYAPLGNSRLVLAGRVALGSMTGSASADIPASIRYYAGGGGSVRGYAYQALGPRDAKGDPLGGRSFQEINLEARFKVTDSIGIVPFVDGGMVGESEYPELGQKLDWALGIGLRYFTPVGPVRFDVAFPMTHIGRDKRFQLYISIGQAF